MTRDEGDAGTVEGRTHDHVTVCMDTALRVGEGPGGYCTDLPYDSQSSVYGTMHDGLAANARLAKGVWHMTTRLTALCRQAVLTREAACARQLMTWSCQAEAGGAPSSS
eukprot:CAMPEP_0185548458 /NCGR_PEP_ID=MMETSP1381-20130426/6770_1 /TAXON_ID=298111 /ORGANISM="Pavlova sp., Strain CCMP459" /LENGTH=108 /DNA_ID=CAMNT_0028161091 /DNA_START=75 /DNA_END=401 /DNA_ORIENTATION=-